MKIAIAILSATLTLSAFAQPKSSPTGCSNPTEKPEPQPQFGGALMCHEAALELENVTLKITHTETLIQEQAKAEFDKNTAAWTARQKELMANVLLQNPDMTVNQNGALVKKAAPKPETPAAPSK